MSPPPPFAGNPRDQRPRGEHNWCAAKWGPPCHGDCISTTLACSGQTSDTFVEPWRGIPVVPILECLVQRSESLTWITHFVDDVAWVPKTTVAPLGLPRRDLAIIPRPNRGRCVSRPREGLVPVRPVGVAGGTDRRLIRDFIFHFWLSREQGGSCLRSNFEGRRTDHIVARTLWWPKALGFLGLGLGLGLGLRLYSATYLTIEMGKSLRLAETT
ncbi:hypothetical protein QBC39DRAFT_1036 [Podospora conica]|nr:hypothetical protein QBC39DRAFT_1036 [Schizothecium conicum]